MQLGESGHALTQCGDSGTDRDDGTSQSGGDLAKRRRACRSEVDWTAGDFGFQDGTGEQPDGIVGVDDLHRAIGGLGGKHR